jgi:hypothetical protein
MAAARLLPWRNSPQQHVLVANAGHVELAGLSKREPHHLLAIGGQPGPYRPGPVLTDRRAQHTGDPQPPHGVSVR